ncbi:MAG: primase C-terminal domain-containing protein [Dechloromonas sp.]|nr:primase C-terminal domain-containing protein [Dechloromonas sp.]
MLPPPTTGVAEGLRNSEAFKRSCTLFENGHSTEEVLEAMNGWNLSNSPPLDHKELARTVKSAERHVARMVSAGGNFVDWRDNRGGAEALMDHLLKLDLTGFNAKGNAPVTEAKEEMIRQGKSDLERWLTDVVEDEVNYAN